MEKNVLEYLETSATLYPNKCAVHDEFGGVTYTELISKAKSIGSYLKKYGCTKRPVMVIIDRTKESIVMFMGVLYSGNFYVPVDPELPEKRIRSIVDTLQPIAILSLAKHADKVSFLGEISIYEDICVATHDESYLSKIRNQAVDMDPLYCIFTSGSTGTPKGVLITHKGVINLTGIFQKEFEFCTDDIFGNQAPFDFDVSTKDIYNAFRIGGTIEIIPKQFFSFPVKLIGYLNERRITVAFWAVTALVIVANIRAMKKVQPLYLRKVLFSGEVLPVRVLNYWLDALPDTLFVNLYGPTEITCNCTFYKIERRMELTEVLPIGKGFPNMSVFLIDENGSIPKKGEPGEICISGSNVGLGYYNNPEKTAEAFVQNPLNKLYYERIYRTGDLAYENEDGNLVFLSRKDFQIKHMGHRIEMQEIEVAVNSLDYIHNCCCLYNKQREKIILVYSAKKACDLELKEILNTLLPKYMIPNTFVYMEKLPLNSHAKIDRKSLAETYT